MRVAPIVTNKLTFMYLVKSLEYVSLFCSLQMLLSSAKADMVKMDVAYSSTKMSFNIVIFSLDEFLLESVDEVVDIADNVVVVEYPCDDDVSIAMACMRVVFFDGHVAFEIDGSFLEAIADETQVFFTYVVVQEVCHEKGTVEFWFFCERDV